MSYVSSLEDLQQPYAQNTQKEEIFINLSVLAKIKPGDKLILEKDKLLNIDTSIFPSLMRWINGINRMVILRFINDILEKSFELHDLWLKEEKNQLVFRITSDLKNALDGLLNLKHTYSTDKLVQSELDVMMENIRTQTSRYLSNQAGFTSGTGGCLC